MRFLSRTIQVGDYMSGALRTWAAREVALLGHKSRLTNTARIYNILGRHDAIEIGDHCVISGHLLTFAHGGSIRIGDWVFLGAGSRIWSATEVVIGNRVLISHNVDIHDTNSHPIDAEDRFRHTQAVLASGHPRIDPGIKSSPVAIGDDAWIGYGASILRGVRIGKRAIIGARSIVNEDVPDDAIVTAASSGGIRQPSSQRGGT